MPKFSVKRPFVILVGIIIVLVLGGVSYSRMTTDLLPHMNMPYMLVLTTYVGASPEKVESDITEPMESQVGTVNGVKNVNSISSENSSMVYLEFQDDTNMDAAMVKVTSAVNQLELPDNAGTPMVMEISMDMMATLMTSVDYEGKEGVELSKFIEDNVIPTLERENGVASVNGTGMIEESVEVVLNQDKIDDVNEQILEKTNKSLAKARKKIDKAEQKLQDGKSKLESQQEKLSDQQEKQTTELAKYTKLMNQALATKVAYESQLASLKASRTALQTEKKAYQDNKVETSYKQMNQGLKAVRASFAEGGAAYQAIYQEVYTQMIVAMVQSAMDAVEPGTTVTKDNVNTCLSQLGDTGTTLKKTAETQATSTTKTQVAAQLASLPTDVKDAIDNPSKLTAYKKLLEQQGQSEAAKAMTKKNLQSLYNIAEVRIPQIDTELANLKIEIATAQAVVKQVNKSISKAEAQYETVEAGKITAAAAFGSGSAQLSAAETTIKNSESQLDEAKDSFKTSKKTALENANLDQLLTMESLSGILTAENFSMPAGYISQDKTQYLIKVGDEYDSIDAMKETLLCHIDDVGDIRLEDVADINIVNNSEDSYAKVNGNDAVLLSISKASTAGTSSVSKACNQAMEDMAKEYKGLRFTNLMDQGDYIALIVDSVVSNLLWGALLAIIVLFLFLQDVRPTVVVAFSIPLSVLFAIVLMYFTDITLNIISLSGLALGIGMLVDNSIVVIENIYRLRNKGISAARAAVMGANQVAGAIFSSTLTTICVFLPIVFTDGITRQIMQDMCLTIAYSLSASLVVALTVVPTMGSTMLKKHKERKHRFFQALVTAYGKLLRFCLRVKVVPIVVAVVLLVFSIWKVLQLGIVFMPEMGSEQLSFTYTTCEDSTTEEDYALSDEIAKQVKEIEGVDIVGGMMGGTTAMMTNTGGQSKDYSVMVLLDEKYANDNKKIAKKIENILEKCDLEEYEVSDSNMDMSSMMGSGLEIDIYGKDMDKLLALSEDIMKMIEDTGKFEDISNGQEDGDKEIIVTVDKDKAMKYNLTVAQIFQELSGKLTTLSVDEEDYDVKIVDERDTLDTDNLMDYEFETQTTDDQGKTKTETHKLKEFATMSEGNALSSLNRENLSNYIAVTAVPKEGENTTLLSRDLQKKIDKYNAPDGYDIEIAGETETNTEMMKSMLQMIGLAIILIYLIMVAQFQGLLSPFIVLLTLPLAFTGGLLALLITGEELSVMAMMGFLVLAGVVVNNGIVFVDYVNQLRLDGLEKREALVETGQTRMRPILMTALTTILAMSTIALSQDTSAAMSRGMAIVTIGGLAYATLMTLFIVPVFYDIFYRRKIKKIDLGEEEELQDKSI
ncbi:MAG: efflux RND transporter permease subunit [Eubacteriales bacterium]|nr:efflux RND transporter permease subunit [Eubacteriales bacterium]